MFFASIYAKRQIVVKKNVGIGVFSRVFMTIFYRNFIGGVVRAGVDCIKVFHHEIISMENFPKIHTHKVTCSVG